MNHPTAPYPIVVLDRVAAAYADAKSNRPLSLAKQHTLAMLVAAGSHGLDLSSFRDGSGAGPASVEALRMAMTRLRDHLGAGLLPDAVGGRYRLQAPTSHVDAWHLRSLLVGALPEELDTAQLRHLIRPSDPFATFHEDHRLVAVGRELRRDRQLLVERIATERPDLFQGELVDHLCAHLADDPYNERLLLVCSTVLARVGHRRIALNFLARARAEFASLGLEVGRDIQEVERALLHGELPVDTPRHVEEVPRSAHDLPRALAELQTDAYVDIDDRRALLRAVIDRRGETEPVVVVIDGRSGVGKSRLCAELASLAAPHALRVLYTATPRAGGAAFGPLLSLLPELRPVVADIFQRIEDVEARRAALWTAASIALDAAADDHPLVLIVDDCQWLDSYTIDFLVHIAASVRRTGIILVLAGRHGDGSQTWTQLLAALERIVAYDIHLEPFDERAMAQLLRLRRPRLAEEQVVRLTPELLLRSGGLPAVASPLIDALDDVTLTVPASADVEPERALVAAVEQLSDVARTVGVVASIIGPSFTLPDVTAITGLDTNAVLAATDELVRRGLVVERSLSEFAVAHLLIQAAFIGSETRSRLAEWHRTAAAWFADDPHRRAGHLASALPRVPVGEATEALLISADLYMEAGLHRSAASAYRTADELAGPLAPASAGRYARALDLSGLHELARAVRQDAVDRALAAGDMTTALAATVSGLPEAEPIDGDRSLVANLERIEVAQLSNDGERWLLTYQLARQLAIAGRVVDAVTVTRQLPGLATTPRQRIDAAIGRRFVRSATAPPDVRLALLDEAADEAAAAEPEQMASYHLVRAIDLYEAGDVDAARASLAIVEGVSEHLSAWRRWHLMLFEATIATDQGAGQAARRAQRQRAFEFAVRRGVGEAQNGLLVAEFLDLWLRGRVRDLRSALDAGFIDPERSLMMRAGAAVICAETGDDARAREHALQVLDAVTRSPVSQGIAALVIVSEVLAATADPGAVASARDLLLTRGDSMIIVGAGATCLGPVARYVAALEADRARRVELLRAACDLADRAPVPLWQVVTRRDLRRAEGSASTDADLDAVRSMDDAAELLVHPA